MPRQRIHHSRVTYEVPDDFPERLERFKEESGLSWAEIIRRLDIHHETMRRWWPWRDPWASATCSPIREPALRRAPATAEPETQKGRHTRPASPHPHPVTPALPYGSGSIIIEASFAMVL